MASKVTKGYNHAFEFALGWKFSRQYQRWSSTRFRTFPQSPVPVYNKRISFDVHKTLRYGLRKTLTYQTLLFCRVPINPILGFIIRTYQKVGFGRLRNPIQVPSTTGCIGMPIEAPATFFGRSSRVLSSKNPNARHKAWTPNRKTSHNLTQVYPRAPSVQIVSTLGSKVY